MDEIGRLDRTSREGRHVLSMTAEYALRAVSCMARVADQPVSADRIAEQTMIPRRYLTRVLQALAEQGIIRSKSGPGGGYVLVRSPAALTILDVVTAVAPIQRITSCPLGVKAHRRLCPLHAALDEAYARIEDAFAAVTIRQLIPSKGRQAPLCKG